MKTSLALEFKHITFAYDKEIILNDIDFHIHEKEFTMLLGSNGAGKSTILKLILGLLKPLSGEIKIFNENLKKMIKFIGYVPQHIHFDPVFPISVEEMVKLGNLYGNFSNILNMKYENLDEILTTTNIIDLRKRMYFSLSGGQKRRVLIARALINKPKIIILDEPTANIDAQSEEQLYNILADLKKNTTILIVTHDTGFVSGLSDVILCLSEKMGTNNYRKIVKHLTEKTEEFIPYKYGGDARRVLHHTDDICCNICDNKY